MPAKKYYVVWKGLNPGIYESWAECEAQIKGQSDVAYKSFPGLTEAKVAFKEDYRKHLYQQKAKQATASLFSKPKGNCLCVDAACSGNPGDMEYRGVYMASGEQLFHQGPFSNATNNIGEFLAIVHGLAYLKQRNVNIPIYSDSANAIIWVKNKKCKTKLERDASNDYVFELIDRAEKWLKTNTWSIEIRKWETAQWGEIPADFGRK